MEKGFFRRLSRPLVGALLLASLASGNARPSGGRGEIRAGQSTWWDVRLAVTAKGEYVVIGGGSPVSGEYTCRALWEGRLEPDDNDFLLVHVKTEILEWSLRERTGPPGQESVLATPAAPKPTLRMDYVLKDGREVEFVFELGGISIPFHASPLAIALEMPRSSGRAPGGPGQAYGHFVRRGSCRVVIPETDFLEQAPARTFAWDWRRDKQVAKEGRVFDVAQSHAAEAVVAITVH